MQLFPTNLGSVSVGLPSVDGNYAWSRLWVENLSPSLELKMTCSFSYPGLNRTSSFILRAHRNLTSISFINQKTPIAGDENLSFPLPTNSCLTTHLPGTAVHTDLCCPSILYVYGWQEMVWPRCFQANEVQLTFDEILRKMLAIQVHAPSKA